MRPMRNVQALADPFSSRMTELNIWGQINLLTSRVKRRQQHFITMAAAAEDASNEADQLLAELKTERDKLKHAEEMYQEVLTKLAHKEQAASALRKEIQYLKTKPGVTNTASRALSMKQRMAGMSKPQSRPISAHKPSRSSTPVSKTKSFNYDVDDGSSDERATSDDDDTPERPDHLEHKSEDSKKADGDSEKQPNQLDPELRLFKDIEQMGGDEGKVVGEYEDEMNDLYIG